MDENKRKGDVLKEYGFKDQLFAGRVISTAIYQYLLGLDEVRFVKNLEDSKEYQGLGIDFEVEPFVGEKYTVECKSDRWQNGSLFLETECGAKEGCFVTSKADVWVYCHYKNNMAWWLPMAVVRPYVLENASLFLKKPAGSKENGHTWTAWGRIVSGAHLLKNCDGVKALDGIYEGSVELSHKVFHR